MPCRCGQNWAYFPNGAGQPRPATSASSAGASSTADVRPAVQHAGQDVPGLGHVRRAGDVADHAARADRIERGAEQRALQPGQRRPAARGTGASATPAGGAASPGRSTARRRAPGRTRPAATPGPFPSATRVAADSTVGQRGRGQAGRGVLARRKRPAGRRARRRARPAGSPCRQARAHVQPEPVLARHLGPAEGQRRQLACLVLHRGPALAHRADRRRVALPQVDAERRPAGGLASGRRRSSPGSHRPGSAHSVTRGATFPAASAASVSASAVCVPARADPPPSQ